MTSPTAAVAYTRDGRGHLWIQPPPPRPGRPVLTAAELALLRCDGHAPAPTKTWRAPRPVDRLAAAPSTWPPPAPTTPAAAPKPSPAPSAAPAAAGRQKAAQRPARARQCRHPGRVVGRCRNCPRRG